MDVGSVSADAAHVRIRAEFGDVYDGEQDISSLVFWGEDVRIEESSTGAPILGPLHGTFEVRLTAYSTAGPPPRIAAAVGRSALFTCTEDGGNTDDVTVPVLLGPANGTTKLGELDRPRVGATVTRLGEHRVLIFGGEDAGSHYDDIVSPGAIYDAATDEWCNDLSTCLPGEDLPPTRVRHAAVRLADGSVVLVGGQDPVKKTVLGDAWVIPADESASPVRIALAAPRAAAAVEALDAQSSTAFASEGRVLACGGENDTDVLGSCEIIDVSDGTSTLLGVQLQWARYDATATLLPQQQVLIAGGRGAAKELLGSVEFFDVELSTVSVGAEWRCVNSEEDHMCSRRAGHRAVRLPSGNVLLVGGSVAPAGGLSVRFEAEVYVLAQGAFLVASEELGTYPAREGHTVSPLPCADSPCSYLIIGGDDPVTGAGSESKILLLPEREPTIQDMDFGSSIESVEGNKEVMQRADHGAVTLDDGTVLVVGGRLQGDPDTGALRDVHQLFYCESDPLKEGETERYRCPDL